MGLKREEKPKKKRRTWYNVHERYRSSTLVSRWKGEVVIIGAILLVVVGGGTIRRKMLVKIEYTKSPLLSTTHVKSFFFEGKKKIDIVFLPPYCTLSPSCINLYTHRPYFPANSRALVYPFRQSPESSPRKSVSRNKSVFFYSLVISSRVILITISLLSKERGVKVKDECTVYDWNAISFQGVSTARDVHLRRAHCPYAHFTFFLLLRVQSDSNRVATLHEWGYLITKVTQPTKKKSQCVAESLVIWYKGPWVTRLSYGCWCAQLLDKVFQWIRLMYSKGTMTFESKVAKRPLV